MRRLTFTTAGALVILFGFGVGCRGDPQFTGGIRFISEEAIQGIGNSDFRVPGMSYAAYVNGVAGPASRGNQTSIEGVTGSNGISDNPNALTDVTWYIHASFISVIPNCPDITDNGKDVPPGGSVFTIVCYTITA